MSSRNLAAAMSLCLLPVGGVHAVNADGGAPPQILAAALPAADADAAARHAKRLACLKGARDKKLVGAARDAYVKDCVAAK